MLCLKLSLFRKVKTAVRWRKKNPEVYKLDVPIHNDEEPKL